MAWSYATDWIRAIHMFHYRLTEILPEDKLFFKDTVGIRQEIDFNCYLTSMLRLQRAIAMACDTWQIDSTAEIAKAIEQFKASNPYLKTLRHPNEHFDDYLNQKGRLKDTDSRAMAVWKMEINGKAIYRQGSVILAQIGTPVSKQKSWKIEWLDQEFDIDKASQSADILYATFIKWFKKLPKTTLDPMNDNHLVRVFTDANDECGERHAIILDETKSISSSERQAVAAKLGYDETIFINNLSAGDISIFTQTKEIPFAGTAAIAAAWLISELNKQPLKSLHCSGKIISTWQDNGLTWVKASLDTAPAWNHKQLESTEAIDRITPEEAKTMEHTMVWAWTDEKRGLVRARTFAIDWDIPEVEANGSGSMMLASQLEREVEIRHGKGSVIFARPAPNNYADIGGLVCEDDTDKERA
jgi:predicted PhzF superfamily epimerase YddE/YHI9